MIGKKRFLCSQIMCSIGRQKTGKVLNSKNRMVAEKSPQFHHSSLMTFINLTRNYITCNKKYCQIYFLPVSLKLTLSAITRNFLTGSE